MVTVYAMCTHKKPTIVAPHLQAVQLRSTHRSTTTKVETYKGSGQGELYNHYRGKRYKAYVQTMLQAGAQVREGSSLHGVQVGCAQGTGDIF